MHAVRLARVFGTRCPKLALQQATPENDLIEPTRAGGCAVASDDGTRHVPFAAFTVRYRVAKRRCMTGRTAARHRVASIMESERPREPRAA